MNQYQNYLARVKRGEDIFQLAEVRGSHHLRSLADKNNISQFVVLAVFHKNADSQTIIAFESVMMLYWQTFNEGISPSLTGCRPESTYGLVKDVARA